MLINQFNANPLLANEQGLTPLCFSAELGEEKVAEVSVGVVLCEHYPGPGQCLLLDPKRLLHGLLEGSVLSVALRFIVQLVGDLWLAHEVRESIYSHHCISSVLCDRAVSTSFGSKICNDVLYYLGYLSYLPPGKSERAGSRSKQALMFRSLQICPVY